MGLFDIFKRKSAAPPSAAMTPQPLSVNPTPDARAARRTARIARLEAFIPTLPPEARVEYEAELKKLRGE